ncbi:brother of CDO-like [Haliotis rubra]|uniref:brother of CDO-like n=1 Tax=Haliotis rubra TaxID=36100 RepID=UPI001EE59784|nr:brother of CDO-like [Haliotis rubra]
MPFKSTSEPYTGFGNGTRPPTLQMTDHVVEDRGSPADVKIVTLCDIFKVALLLLRKQLDRPREQPNLNVDPRIQISAKGTLYFLYVNIMDTAVYQCGVTTSSTIQLGSPVQLNVTKGNVADTSPVLMYSSETTDATQGQAVTQQCIFSGRPVPVVTWYRDDKQVTNTTRAELSYTTVTIKNVSDGDAGIYRCTGKNGVSSDSHDVTLIVTVPRNDKQSTTPVQQDVDTTAASFDRTPSVLVIVLTVVFIVLVLIGAVVCTMIW